ncbi:MAG: GNAT family N-acetyltransferase [Rhodospirillales bacterium]
MAADIAEIVALEIDPLLANIHGIVALTADIRLARAPAQPAEARLAIRPYPSEFEKTVHAPDGRTLTLRPIRPEDEPALQAFILRQPPEDRRLQFFVQVKELNHQVAARLTQIDCDREMAFVLIDRHAEKPAVLGLMSIFADPEGARAEYAGAVRSDLKGQGLGGLLLEEIVGYCQRRGIREIWGEVLRENAPMLGLARKLGFSIKRDRDDPSVMIVTRPLQ